MTTALIADSDRISLYCREGPSDKVYNASIEPSGSGFVVNFSYGRRGSTLNTGTKTPTSVDYDTARRTFDKLVKEKMAKGYTRGSAGTPYKEAATESRVTGILPQLLNPIDQAQANILLRDSDWWMQEKVDGKRVLILRSGETITGINRKGLSIALPAPVAERARAIGGDGAQWLMDGESVGERFFAFDLLENHGTDLRVQPYSVRLRALYNLVSFASPEAIRATETALGTDGKRIMLAALRRGRREGAVFKRHDAPYTPGRPASGGAALKLKFTATASCIVMGVNGTKRSVALILIDGPQRVGVGSVTIPANQPVPPAGSIIEVKYLYAFAGGSLYQPVYLGRRDDINLDACTLEQLKFKADDEVIEA